MIQPITKTHVSTLQRKTGDFITIYVPLQKGPLGHKQTTSQLHALRAQLKRVVSTDVMALINQSFDDVIKEIGYKNQHNGLLLSIGDLVEVYALPFTPIEQLHRGSSLHLEQLRHYFGNNREFYVLSISKNGSHLYRGDKTHLQHEKVADIDKDMLTLLHIDEKQAQELQNHPVMRRGRSEGTGFHGQGGGKDHTKQLFEAYLRLIDRRVMNYTKNKRHPLVVVAANYGQSLYRRITKYPALVNHGILKNPEALSSQDLHENALTLVGLNAS